MSRWSYRVQKRIVIVSFLFFPLLLLALFTYYPAFNLVYLSFTAWDGYSPEKEWVGWANYAEVFSEPEIFGVFVHNLAYFAGGIVQNGLALLFAVILNGKLKGRHFFRVLLFLPFVVNSVAISYMFQYFYDTGNGSLNTLLRFAGLEEWAISWLGSQKLVNYCLAFVSMWKYMGFNMVIYLGALQSIPSDIYESAKIDGANGFRTFWHMTLPNMLRIIELNLFLTVTGALEVFDIPFVLTQGGPLDASTTFVMKTVETAFEFSDYGLASAMSVILMFIVVAVVSMQRAILKGGER